MKKYFLEDSTISISPKAKDNHERQLKNLETKGLLTEFRNKEANRQRSYRASMSDEKRKQCNQNTKERMLRYRQKLKDKASNTTSSLRIKTRKEQKLKDEEAQKQRLYWCMKQQECRLRQTKKKKQETNDKKRAKQALKKKKNAVSRNLEEGHIDNGIINNTSTDKGNTDSSNLEVELNMDKENIVSSEEGRDYNSTASVKNTIDRVNTRMPRTPQNCLGIVGEVTKRPTTRENRLLKKTGLVVSPDSKKLHSSPLTREWQMCYESV